MTESNDRFTNGNYPSNLCIFKYYQSFRRLECDYFCFVEGKTDELFYGNIQVPFFCENHIIYIYSERNDNNPNLLLGKKAVVEACKFIYKFSYKELVKIVFVIDHDFLGLDDCKDETSLEAKRFITVLPVYSFENYFMQEDNLSRILKLYLNDVEISIFSMKYNKFLKSVKIYFALKRTIIANYCGLINGTKTCKYRKIHDDKNIFFFNFNQEPYFKVDQFNIEEKSMSNFIFEQPCLVKYYEKSIALLSINTNFLKGKILFRFLSYYLNQLYKIKIYEGEYYISLVKNINIDLNVVLPSTIINSGRER